MIIAVKAGVAFDKIAPAGFRILSAIEHAARSVGVNLTITSACDGEHSGPTDPHKRGCAYDVRVKNLSEYQRVAVLRTIMLDVADDAMDAPVEQSGGLATRHFFGFLEAPGTGNQHLHLQLRKGAIYS